MNLKKFVSLLLFILLGVSSFVVAESVNNKRNVYSVYSDNFNGVHFYDYENNPNVPEDDGDGIKFDIWNDQWTPNGTMRSTTIYSSDGDIAPEGKSYTRYIFGEYTWAGCAYARKVHVTDDAKIDMTAYEKVEIEQTKTGEIKFVLRSQYPNVLDKCQVGFIALDGTNVKYQYFEFLKNLSVNFSSNTTSWQEFSYKIPTDAAPYLDKVTTLFALKIENVKKGSILNETLDIDNIRWVKPEVSGVSFSVIMKNISDNKQVNTSLTFSPDAYGQSNHWPVTQQYLELDIDGEFSQNNWGVRLYSSSTTAGLYDENNPSKVLPMSWKVSCSTLPYVYVKDKQTDKKDKNTFEIGENWSEDGKDFYGYYDLGKYNYTGEIGDKWWFPWFAVKPLNDTTEDSLVWTNEGYHTFQHTEEGESTPVQSYDSPASSYCGVRAERKPKIYLACNIQNAEAVKYVGSLIIKLSYE